MNDSAKEVDTGSRVEAVMMHPLFAKSVALLTLPTKELYAIIKRVIIHRESSVTITGQSGAGKSCALTVLEALVKAEFPRICVIVHHAHNQQYATGIRSFFKHFLGTVGHKEQKGETYDLRQRLVRILLDDARVAGMNIIVFMIDEANAMTLEDFLFLKDVGNDLDDEGVQLITIMIGQSPDLDMTLDKLAMEGRLDLLARFALRRHKIRQASTAEDLRTIFDAIDRHQYPPNSNATWTEFFAPKAFKAGFRLVQQTENCRDSLLEVLNPKGLKNATFPTRQLFSAIRCFLLELAANDAEDFSVAPTAWGSAIQESMIKEAAELADRRSIRAREKGRRP